VSGGHLRRPMYYLTGGDETLGELARYALQTDQTIIQCASCRSISRQELGLTNLFAAARRRGVAPQHPAQAKGTYPRTYRAGLDG
jgi:hypothetical protein